MKKITLHLILIPLIVLTVLIIKIKLNKSEMSSANEIKLYDFVGELLLRNTQIQQEHLGSQIITNNELASLDNKNIWIENALGSKKKLLFLFSGLNCPQCIDFELELIKNHQEIIGADNIILLASDFNNRALKTYKKRFNLECRIYQINSGRLQLPIDNLNIPYYILTDSTKQVLDIFIPVKEIPNYNRNFLLNTGRRINSEIVNGKSFAP